MLTLLFGPDHKVYRKEIMSRLLENIKASDEKQYMIVPEQFSFDAERQLCLAGGDEICLRAEVLSLSRLADRVESIYGGKAMTWLDHGGQLLAAAQAVEQVYSRLKLFAGVCRRTEFLESFVTAAEEFGSYGVAVQTLSGLSKTAEGQFSQKLEELALLYESYLSVCAQAMDPVKRLQHLRDLLRRESFAEGKDFYICGFSDFTLLEREVVEALILSANSVHIAVPSEDCDGEPVFASASEMAKSLTLFCNRNNIPVKTEKLGFADGANESLLYLQKNAAKNHCPAFTGRNDAVRFYRFTSVESECRFAAARVAELVKAGEKYSDIAIACADFERYKPQLMSVLRRGAIPAFFSGKTPILENTAVGMILFALRACAEGFERDAVLDYLKTGATPLTADACDRLENYARLWNIHGSRWSSEWTLHPGGISSEWYDKDRRLLEKLNDWRERALAPLISLRQSLAAAENVQQMADCVLNFAEDIHLHERLQSLSDQAFDRGDIAQARTVAQIYDTLLDSLEQISLVIPNAVRSVEEFCRLYEKLLSQYGIATVPATLNQVTVGELNSLRNRSVKHLIILGAAENHFPRNVQGSGVFTEQERQQLMLQGLHMAPLHADVIDRELSHIYSVLRSATQSLCLSCSGEEPSYVFVKLAEMFGGAASINEDVLLDEAELAAAYLRAECSVCKDAAAQERIKALQARSKYTFGTVSQENVRKLYGENIFLSASRIDKFAACRFAFFLRYGLKADPVREVRFDASEFGTFVHDVLENTAKRVMDMGGFKQVTEETLLQIADECMREYVNSVLRDMTESDERFSHQFERNCEEARAVVRDLGNEMRVSDFVPAAFELSFGNKGEMEPIQIHGQTADSFVSGFVDRVDLYEQDDHAYVRVVDYKTGRKTFDYAELTIGEGLQMLIYLFALKRNGEKAFGKPLTPAGVLYHPARKDLLSSSERLSAEEAEDMHRDMLVRKGLVVEDDFILSAMEHFEDAPQYLPFKLKKDGARSGDLASREEMHLLEEYVFKTLERITDEIYSGDVQPNPVIRGANNSACTYCDFSDVCQKDFAAHKERRLKKITNREFFAEIQKKEDAAHD